LPVSVSISVLRAIAVHSCPELDYGFELDTAMDPGVIGTTALAVPVAILISYADHITVRPACWGCYETGGYQSVYIPLTIAHRAPVPRISEALHKTSAEVVPKDGPITHRVLPSF
jgi:hypothetical protein